MPREFTRNVRIAEAIRRITAPEIDSLARAAGLGMVTITDVNVASDLSIACIYVSVYGTSSAPTKLEPLRDALPQLRSKVAHELRLKKMPKLIFELDKSVSHGARISELLSSPKSRH
ncbi:MAG: 30S ribosome-binding factor RbfA [Gammaproteobacteria bacterium]|nr:30S ribosome-binding factor RbfA [Gammaproteobacteria bacterium]